MAKINVDRHILMEIVGNNKAMDDELVKMATCYQKMLALHERNNALQLHLVGEIELVDTGKGQEQKQKGGDE